ncbi:putative Peptidyl-prolyl cis-trans isomerase CYP71 [Blattamonas nauphoetae]|uniref:peptidylprolyl isomerase n=1 Tax=Blattamonas nauphoetae TaxID=2049346 RepID=A0ABQ9YLN1_9EUKA|nr:putative Peptidyl-prolyl cis-trans isomerase CYP71 [Blattamonas nauphoetae]
MIAGGEECFRGKEDPLTKFGSMSQDGRKPPLNETEEEPLNYDIQPVKRQAIGEDEPTLTQPEKELPQNTSIFRSINPIAEQALPNATMYEKSFKHLDVITHVKITPTNYLITASKDGVVKFWRKLPGKVLFIKSFQAHSGPVTGLSVSQDGVYMITCSPDKYLKTYDVVSFDVIRLSQLDFTPKLCAVTKRPREGSVNVMVSDLYSQTLRIFDAIGEDDEGRVFENALKAPAVCLHYLSFLHAVVVADSEGRIDILDASNPQYPPSGLKFGMAEKTDLHSLHKNNIKVLSLEPSKDGRRFSVFGSDRVLRVFDTLTGQILVTFHEDFETIQAEHKRQKLLDLDDAEFGHRLNVERQVEKEVTQGGSSWQAIFDETGEYIMYGTHIGIKVYHITTRSLICVLGSHESSLRILSMTLFQGVPDIPPTLIGTVELQKLGIEKDKIGKPDPTLFCTALGKDRFYCFSRREPAEESDYTRNVMNERPSTEEVTLNQIEAAPAQLAHSAILHTTMGDVTVSLYPDDTPKAVENFVVHSKNGYYNNLIFHRVIKGFMIQGGDPLSSGNGGTSIWGTDFDDEIVPTLRFDKPFILAMANAGPNTNGSQFFITTVATPWLNGKHTIFGRVVTGTDVISRIENVETGANDKPVKDVRIMSITIT